MPKVEVLLLLLLGVLLLTGLAQKIQVPYPVILVIGGLILGFIPGLPVVALDPSLILVLFLPPLIYSAAWFTSWREMRRNIRSISLLAVVLVLLTTVLVGVAAHLLIPRMSWAAGFLLGAIVSPTDVVAAEAIAQRLSMPRRILSVVQGESLVNDATGLVTYRFALAAVLTGVFSFWSAAGQFILVSAGGIVIGLIVGVIGAWLHGQLRTPQLDITLSLLLPFFAYLPADAVGASGVLAVVTAGIYIGQRAPHLFTSSARLDTNAFWNALVFLLNGVIFILIGFQLRVILTTTARTLLEELFGAALAISIVVMAARILWTYPGSWLAWRLGGIVGPPTPKPIWTQAGVVSWMGMRGVVSLAAALALPVTGEGGLTEQLRASIIFITFVVILVTLLVQGLSLPIIIRRLGLDQDKTRRNEMRLARVAAAQAALDQLDTLNASDAITPDHLADLRTHYQERIDTLSALQPDRTPGERRQAISQWTAQQRVQLALLDAERQRAIALRDDGEIGDEVLHAIMRDLDYEELGVKPLQSSP